MVKLKPKQMRALAWYCEEFGYIPQLSTPPFYRFTERGTGHEKRTHIDHITFTYEVARKAQKKADKKT